MGVSLIHTKTSFSLCVSTVEKKREENPHRKTHVYHAWTPYPSIVENSVVLCSALKTVFLYILIFGVPFSFPFFACPISALQRVECSCQSPKKHAAHFMQLGFFSIFFFFFPFLDADPRIDGPAQRDSLQAKPQFSCDETQPKTHSDLWYHQWRDETRKKKQVQPQFSSSIFLF